MKTKNGLGVGAPTGETKNNWVIKTIWVMGVLIIMFFSLSGGVWADKCDITFVKEIKAPEGLSEDKWNPLDVAVDSQGRIITTANGKIWVFDNDGNFIKSFMPYKYGAKEVASRDWIFGIAVDSQDRIIVTDKIFHRVQIFDKEGNFIKVIGSSPFGYSGKGEGEFDHPYSVATDSEDRIIVLDSFNERIQIVDNDGNFIKAFGKLGEGKGEFRFDTVGDVAVDSHSRIIVVDVGNDRIQMFDKDGNFIKVFGTVDDVHWGSVEGPYTVAVDSHDRIIVGVFEYRLVVFDSMGDPITIFDDKKLKPLLSETFNFAIDLQNRIIAADKGGLKIFNLKCTSELKINVPSELLSGKIFDVKITFGNLPVENAKVQYANQTKITNPNGQVQFIAKAGTHTIEAIKEGYEPVSISVTSKEPIPYRYILLVIVVLVILTILFTRRRKKHTSTKLGVLIIIISCLLFCSVPVFAFDWSILEDKVEVDGIPKLEQTEPCNCYVYASTMVLEYWETQKVPGTDENYDFGSRSDITTALDNAILQDAEGCAIFEDDTVEGMAMNVANGINTVIEGAGYGDALSAKVSGVSKDKIEKEINAGHPLVAVLGKIVYEWTCDEPPLGCRDKRKPPFTQDENGNYVPNPAMYHAVTIAGYTTDGKIIFYDPANGGYFIHNIFSDEYQDDENGYSKGISALITISPPPSPPDSDDDGVPDSQDWCPAEKGDSSNHGCPYSPTVKIDNPADGGKLNIDVTGITCGTVSVTATATDKDSDLDKFEIYFDGGLIPSSKCSFIKDTGGEKKLQCSSDPIARDTTHVIMAKAMDKTNRFSTYAVDVTCHDDISDIFLKIREPKNSEGVYYHSIVFDAQKSKYWSLGNPSVAVDGNPLSSISSTSFSGRELYWSWWNPFDYDIGSSHSIVAKLHRCPLGSSGCGSPTDEKHRDADAISVNVAEPPLDVVFLKSLFGLQGTWLIEAKVIHEAIAEIQAEVASTPTHVATTKVNNNGEFSFYLDTTDFDNGNHTLILKMYDENKNLIGIKTYPMSINNPTIDSIQITSPGNASSLQNNITINASATGTVKEIEIKIDGSRICRQESKTISCIFNTQNLLNGSHVITATAYTPSYTSKSASITVTVSNVKQPGVNLSSPVNGSNVSGIVELSAAVYDWDGNLINNFNDLEYYVDGNVSYKYWDSRIYPHGSSHTVYAVAYDGMGNNVTSKTVTVTVIDLPPKVAFLNLTNGSNVTEMMIITADISDDRGIKNINLTIDGVEYDYPYLWDPSGVSNGNHTIKIIVTDTGNRTNGTEVRVNVNATKLVIDEGKNITFTMPGDLFAYVSVPMSANVTNASMDLTGLYAYASEINISGGLANDGNYNTYYALGPIDSSHITESEIGQVTSVIVNVYFYITDEDSDDTNYTMQFENVTGEWIIFDSGQWYEGVAYNKSFNLASQYILSGGRYRCQLTIKTDNGDEYLNIYEVEALNAVSYPTNASLDIANNCAIEWNHTGKFNTTVAIADTRNFKETLNLILQNNCSCSSCEIISGRCLIPLKFHSDSTGTLQISNLTLEYNATSSPPAVNITSPADGAVVNNTVIINASASDDTGILKVEFYLDGELICMDVQEPYSCEWNTVNQISGHTIAAVAYDYDGQVGYDVISTVIAGDAPPAVEITNPAPGLVNGTVSIQAIVTDDIGIGRVEVLVDGSEICYSLPCFWNTLEDANGTHNVTVIVYDTAMQSSNDTVIVTLIDTPPAVEILNPLGGLTLNNTVTVNVSAGDDRGVDRVEFYVDGNLSQITASAYLFDWDTNEVGNGEHTLRAVAYDELNQTTENVTTVNVNNDAFPFVNITNPVEGSVVREVINLNANVTDDIGIDRVQWYAKGNITVCDETNASNCTNVNERLLCNLTVGGAAENISVCSLNTSILEDWNVCEIEIIVNDTSGHVSKDRVYVFVINDKPPKVNITSHSDGDYVWGNTTFNATYYDDINVTGIEWFVDDGLVCNASPCVFDFEDEKVSPGEHYVRAVVYDTRGEYGLDVAGVFNCYKIINISSNISGVLADNESICVYDNETCECQIGINLVRVKNNNIPVSDIPVNFSVNDPDFNGVTAEAGNITVSGTNRGYAMIHFPDQAVAHKVGNKILYIPVVSGSNKVCVDADTTSKADIEYRLNHNCDGGEWVYNPPKVTINSINYYKITSSETSEVSGTGGGEGELPPPHPVPDLNPIEFLILFTSAFLLFASLVREREPGKLA